MGLLREFVDEANKLRTQRITLNEGKRPSFFTIRGAVEPKKFDPLTPNDMDQLFASIFTQTGDLSRHQRHARKFKILELGEVDCIGLTDLRQINIYLASGASLYTLDYARFFPKSASTGEEEQEVDDAEQVNEQEEDSNLNGTDNNMIDVMISFSDEPATIQEDANESAKSPSNLQPQDSPTPTPPLLQSNVPDSAGDDVFRLDIPSLNDNPADAPQPDTSAQKVETSPEVEVTPEKEGSTGVFQLAAQPDSQPERSQGVLDSVIPKEDSTAAPPTDVNDLLQNQNEGAAAQEETGVQTDVNKVASQLDQVVAESSDVVEDDKSQFVSTPTSTSTLTPTSAPQETVEKQTLSTVTGTSMVSDGSHAIDKLLQEIMTKKASDLHLSCNHPVMMRIGGQIEKVNAGEKITPEALQNWLNPIIPTAAAARLAQSGDVDFTYELKGVGRFRVNVLQDLHGIGAVLRYVPASLRTLEELEAPEIVKKFCYLSKGLVILNGPAGSGRSTTMTAMIDVINTVRKAHLLSIEEQIEFVHTQKNSLIRQREVGTHTNSVQEGLRAALREDPDIICTDEIREAEAMLMAMKCAEAGQLVFSMMHTRNSVSAIDSIINQFTPAHQNQARHLLASTLRGIICQTLVRKKSGSQVGAWEVLIVSDEAAAMIKTGRTQQITAHMIAHRVKGNILLNDSLLKLVNEGTVSFNNALIAAADKRALHALAHRRGLKLSA